MRIKSYSLCTITNDQVGVLHGVYENEDMWDKNEENRMTGRMERGINVRVKCLSFKKNEKIILGHRKWKWIINYGTGGVSN